MMQYIRERATSKFAKFLFLGIIISFFGFGTSGFFSDSGNATVAKVNGEKISTIVLSNAYTSYLQKNGGILPDGVQAQSVKMQVLNGLIQEMVVAQAARNMGIVASDDEIRKTLLSFTNLHNAEGQFDPDLYKFFLQQQGMTAAEWENNLRQELTLQLLYSAIGSSVIVTQANIDDFAKVDREKRSISLLNISLDRFADKVSVTDEMVANYYEQNKAGFSTEPRVKLSYVTLPEVDTSNVSVSDDEINARVAELKAKQQSNETRSSNQLIIQFSTETEKEEALRTLNIIYDELMAGSLSYDDAKTQVTALSDGLFYETGIVRKSTNMQPIDEVLFALAENEKYAKPMATDNAVHLIHLLAINGGNSDVADDAFIEQAKTALLKEKKESLNADNVQRFQEVAEKNADSLELIAQGFQIEPTDTDWLSLTAKDDELADANTLQVITQEMVLLGGKNSEAYHTDNQEIRIVRVTGYEDVRPLSLDEASEQIRQLLTTLEMQKQAEALIADMNGKLKQNGQTLAQVAEEYGLAVESFDNVEIRSIVSLAQKNPELIEPLIKGFEVQESSETPLHSFALNGGVSAVMVSNITQGSVAEYSETELSQLKEGLTSNMAEAETILFIQGLYDQSKIEIYQVPFLTE